MVRSLDPPGFPRHRNPIPAAALHRGIPATSAISGLEPETGVYPADKAVQVARAFSHLEALLEDAGSGPQDVVKMDLYLRDKTDRELVKPHWTAMFPDEAARPARHAHVAALPDGCCLHIAVLAAIPNCHGLEAAPPDIGAAGP